MPGNWDLPPKGGHMDKRTGIYVQTMTMRDIEERLKKKLKTYLLSEVADLNDAVIDIIR